MGGSGSPLDLFSGSSGVVEYSVLLLRVSCVLWGRNGQVNMDKRLRQEAFVFYLKKKEVHVSKSKALLSHRKKWGPEVSQGE